MAHSLIPKWLFWGVVILILHTHEFKACVEMEKVALLQVKKHLSLFLSPSNDQYLLPSWFEDGSENCCSWERVKCDHISGHVIELSLDSLADSSVQDSGLNISINMTVFQDFEKLQSLDLSSNFINILVQDEAICELRDIQVLSFTQNEIKGRIPDCIINLSFLRRIDLSHNQFTGNIPLGVCNLKRLKLLDLSSNELNGRFPLCIGDMWSLTYLHLSDNQLSGSIPSGICKLEELQELYLDSNNLNGSLPSCIAKLTSLRMVELSGNQFTGSLSLSSIFVNLTSLEELSLFGNYFEGNFNSFEDLIWRNCSPNTSVQFCKYENISSRLQYLDLSENKLSGNLPESFGLVFSNLEYLGLSTNYFEGRITDSIGEIRGIQVLELSHNYFDGEVPKQLFNSSSNNLLSMVLSNNNLLFGHSVSTSSSNLEMLDISHNQVSGRLPSWIGNFKQLGILSVRGNMLEGQISPALRCLSSLSFLDLSNNRLSGGIPSCNGSLSSLEYLHLNNNSLSGNVPNELSNCSSLVVLDLRGNQFVGDIPSWIGQLSYLRVLQLGNNKLQGELPSELCHLQLLNVMDVGSNGISGMIPPCLKDLSFGLNTTQPVNEAQDYLEFMTKGRYNDYVADSYTMSGLDLSFNQFSGHIPSELGDLKGIISLNLSHNKLNGSIPKTFSTLGNVESLDLSYNNLSGAIPLELAKLNFLEVFNVSYNNSSGRVPMAGQFGTFDAYSYKANPYLYGYIQDRSFVASEPPHASFGEDIEHTKFDWRTFFWSFGPSCIIFMLGSILMLYSNPQWLSACLLFIDVQIHRWFRASY